MIAGLVTPSTAPVSSVGAVQAASASCLSADEAELLDRINTWRIMNKLAPLNASPTLSWAARHHAESMATHNYFPGDYSVRFEGPDHNETISWQENIANAGYPDNTHTVRSAIVGAGTDSPATIFTTLTELPAYEAVLADRRFQAIGIGFGSDPDSDEDHYWALTFGSLSDQVIEPCDGVAVQIPILQGGRTTNSTDSNLAFDGDFETDWSTNGSDVPRIAYVWFDLGTPHELSRIEWMNSTAGIADNFSIDISLDGESWTEIAQKSNGSVDEWRSIRWSGTARFVRFYFSNPNGDPVVGGLSEVRIFQ